jgi:hypothetical protein
MKTLNHLMTYLIICLFVVSPILNGCASTRGNQLVQVPEVEIPIEDQLEDAEEAVKSADRVWKRKLVTLTEKYREWNQANTALNQMEADHEDRPAQVNVVRVALQSLEDLGKDRFPDDWKRLRRARSKLARLQPVAEPAEEEEPLITARRHELMGISYLAKFKSLSTTFWLANAELSLVKSSLNKHGRTGETCDKNSQGVYEVPDYYELSINNYRAHRDRNWPDIGDEFPEPIQVATGNADLVVDDQRTDRPNREVQTEEVTAQPAQVDRTQTGPRKSLLQNDETAQLEAEWTRDNGDGTSDSVLLRGDMPLPETKVIVVKDDELEDWEIGLISLGVIGTVALIVLVPLAEAGYLSPSSPTFSF